MFKCQAHQTYIVCLALSHCSAPFVFVAINKHDMSSEHPHECWSLSLFFCFFCSHAMLAHRVIYFGALSALLAFYSGIYLDAFKGVAILACVFIVYSLRFSPDFLFSSMHHSASTTSELSIGSYLIYGFSDSVCLMLLIVWNIPFLHFPFL